MGVSVGVGVVNLGLELRVLESVFAYMFWANKLSLMCVCAANRKFLPAFFFIQQQQHMQIVVPRHAKRPSHVLALKW